MLNKDVRYLGRNSLESLVTNIGVGENEMENRVPKTSKHFLSSPRSEKICYPFSLLFCA
jgi:hypothetical protein